MFNIKSITTSLLYYTGSVSAQLPSICNQCNCNTVSVYDLPSLSTGLEIDCSNQGLTAIPNDLPAYTTKLILDNNLISGELGGPTADDLSSSSFSSISSFNNNNYYLSPLSNLSNLKELSLSNNQITSINPRLFNNNQNSLSYLSRLILSSNKIKSLPSSIFKRLNNLSLLDLNSNNLNFIQRWLFNGLHKLQFLDLSNNQITLIHQNALDDTPELVEIRIHKNKIRALPNIPNQGTLEKIYAFNNELVCDCVMGEFLKNYGNSLSSIQNPDYVICQSPPILKNRPIMKIEIEEFLCVDPEITRISENQILNTGDLLNLYCEAQGFPLPEITWIAPDGSILSSRKTLYIPSVSQMDAGVYECKASNAQGAVFEHVNIGIRAGEESQYKFESQNGNFNQGFDHFFTEQGLKRDCPRPCHCYKDTIDCRNKAITELPIGLEHISWVNNLYLSGNHLSGISSLPKQLRHLTLDDNPLRHLNEASFRDMKQLTHLSLNNCSLSKDLPTTAFTRMEALKTLVLSNNPIRELKMETLFGLTSLNRLYLERCQLERIDDAAFLTLYKIKYLYLGGNYLTTISPKWFESFTQNQLIKVQLRDNRWNCECEMVDFMDLVLHQSPWLEDVTEVDVLKCSTPFEKMHDTIVTAADQLLNQCTHTMNFGSRSFGISDRFFDDPNSLREDLDIQYDELLEDMDDDSASLQTDKQNLEKNSYNADSNFLLEDIGAPAAVENNLENNNILSQRPLSQAPEALVTQEKIITERLEPVGLEMKPITNMAEEYVLGVDTFFIHCYC